MKHISTIIREYAAAALAEYGEGESPAAIYLAIGEAQSQSEVENLGRALLDRHDALADASYRRGGPNYPGDLAAIAAGLRYAGEASAEGGR